MSDPVSARYREALRLGHLAVVKGRPDEAVQHYQEAGRLGGARPLAFILMGDVFLQMRRPRESLRAYDEALRRAPGETDALHGKVRALVADGRKDEARGLEQRIARFEAERSAASAASAGIDDRARSLEAHTRDGSRFRRDGDLDKAAAEFLAAAHGYAEQNHFDAALDACFRALEARPGMLDVHLVMARTYLRRGWREHGVQRALLIDKRLRFDDEPRQRAALVALAREYRSLDPELDRIAATG